MFGIIKPCRNRLGDELRTTWMAHLCGMCLALRDEHGHAARLVTNYDAIVVSALVEAQRTTAAGRRRAGPCALRGMKAAPVATGDSARLAAATSLLLASAKLADNVADGDVSGAVRSRVAGRVASRLALAGTATGTTLSLDTVALLDAAAGQREAEANARSILDMTAPTEPAASLAFRHTAVLAGRPGNEEPLAEAGRLFGRVAHLLDAVEDLEADLAAGVLNPIAAFGLTPDEVRAHCDDAVLGVKLALRDVTFDDDRLVHVLLGHELDNAVRRTFVRAGQPNRPPGPPPGPPPGYPPRAPGGPPPGAPPGPPPGYVPPGQHPPGQRPPGWDPTLPGGGDNTKKGAIAGCFASLVACGTCQACRNQDPNEQEQQKERCGGLGDCCDCCDCCSDCGDCCDCCSCCDC